jgi:tRNA A37 methylthiotransferase MiaB
LVEELTAQRAEERVGATVDVLVESVPDPDGGAPDAEVEGRAVHQAPETDGLTTLALPGPGSGGPGFRVGDIVRARVVASEGVDLVAEPCPTTDDEGGR